MNTNSDGLKKVKIQKLLSDFNNKYKNDENIKFYDFNRVDYDCDCEIKKIEEGWWYICDWVIVKEENNNYSISYSIKGLFDHKTILIIYFVIDNNDNYLLKDWTIELLD